MHRFSILSRPSGLAVLAGFLLLTGPAAAQDGLSFRARIDCQRAIEEVYWQHRIWPIENQEPKPSLEAVLPQEALEARVEQYLRETDALARYWRQPITGTELQAEIDRIAGSTKQPEILAELWRALGSDPYRVAECLARPVLADRLLRERYAREYGARTADRRQPFDLWWEGVQDGLKLEIAEPASEYSLPEIQDDPTASEQWTPTHALPEGNLQITGIWTGSEMIVWGGTETGNGKYNNGARYNPVTDVWKTTSSIGAPPARKQHTAIWTGTEMIVWGGCGPGDQHNCESFTGGRYNPATDTWVAVTNVGNPGARIDHTAVWTGSEMIVWGGCAFYNDGCLVSQVGSTGGRYNPATDSWLLMTTANAPAPRTRHTAVWAGTQMIVWGGAGGTLLATGGRYNATTDTWQPTAAAPLVPRYDHSAVWTGTQMIVWGGTNGPSSFANGGRYYPALNAWRPLRAAGGPTPRSGHAAVWTGNEMIVWGGWTGTTFLNTGGRYSLGSMAWTPTSTVNAPPGRARFASVWTGSQLVVWGGNSRTGGRYDAASNTWTPTNDVEATSAREGHTAVWTGAELLVWGGDDRFFGTVNTGGRYIPAVDSWLPTATAGAPFGRRGHTALWTGTAMIVWGGQYGSTAFNDGGRYNPMADNWVDLGGAGAPEARSYHSAVWTGAGMIVWGGGGETSPWLNTGGRYDASTNAWAATSTVGAPTPRYLHSAVWTGNVMVVWAGATSAYDTNTGGRYNPATNTWLPTSLVNAPSPRTTPAVWTGARMVVWGGQHYDGTYTYYGDGARYDPVSDVWTATSLAGAPGPRAFFAQAWTGTELILWGGCTLNSGGACAGEVATGGRYNPVANTWTSTTLLSAPSPRSGMHTAVWAGNQMIVWGGFSKDTGTYTNTGARYVPGSPAPLDRE